MDLNREKLIHQLFSDALGLAEEERRAFLEKACENDSLLLEQVLRLLREVGSEDDLEEQIIAGIAGAVASVFEGLNGPPLAAGSRFGPYLVEEEIGRGGMGVVYKALDTRVNRPVALKVLLSDGVRDQEIHLRFKREGRAVAALNHPNIVTLYEADVFEGVSYLAMEYLDGRTLDPGEEQVSLPQFLELAVPIARALVEAHDQGVIHRDLKPSNIMVGRNGVKILDFGLARLGDRDSGGSTLTGEGVLMGTYPYMSPEQTRGLALDTRSDLFSLGVIFYELLSGKRPFQGDTHSDLMASILRDEQEPLHRLAPGLPLQLREMIESCLEKDPERRNLSASHICGVLETLRENPPASRQRRVPFSQSLASLTGLFALTGLMVFSFFYIKPDSPKAPPVNNYHRVYVANVKNHTENADFRYVHHAVFMMLEEQPYINEYRQYSLRRELQNRGWNGVGAPESKLLARVCDTYQIPLIIRSEITGKPNAYTVSLQLLDSGELKAEREKYFQKPHELYPILDQLLPQILASAGMGYDYFPLNQIIPKNHTALKLYLETEDKYHRLEKSKLTQIERGLTEVLELEPSFAQAWSKQSVCLYGLGFMRRAFEAAEKAQQFANSLPRRQKHLVKGVLQFNYKAYEEAEKAFLTLIDAGYEDEFILRQLAHCMAAQGKTKEQLVYVQRARQMDRLNVINYGLEIIALSDLSRYDEALEWGRRVIKRFPDTYPHWGMGLAYLGQDRPEEAVNAFRKLKDEKATRPFAEVYENKALLLEGRPDEVVKRMALAETRGTSARISLARLYLLLGRNEDASLMLQELPDLEALPYNLYHLRNAALAALELGDHVMADDLVEKLKIVDAAYPSKLSRMMVCHVMGWRALIRDNNPKEARALLGATSQLTDDYLVYFKARLWMTQQSPDWEMAATQLLDIIENRKGRILRYNFPDFWIKAHLDLARCHAALARKQDALEWYERFLRFWDTSQPELVKEAKRELNALQN